MSMLRKIRRSVAKYNIRNTEDTGIFGKYALTQAKVWDKRSKRFVNKDDVAKSYFSRAWRGWC